MRDAVACRRAIRPGRRSDASTRKVRSACYELQPGQAVALSPRLQRVTVAVGGSGTAGRTNPPRLPRRRPRMRRRRSMEYGSATSRTAARRVPWSDSFDRADSGDAREQRGGAPSCPAQRSLRRARSRSRAKYRRRGCASTAAPPGNLRRSGQVTPSMSSRSNRRGCAGWRSSLRNGAPREAAAPRRRGLPSGLHRLGDFSNPSVLGSVPNPRWRSSDDLVLSAYDHSRTTREPANGRTQVGAEAGFCGPQSNECGGNDPSLAALVTSRLAGDAEGNGALRDWDSSDPSHLRAWSR